MSVQSPHRFVVLQLSLMLAVLCWLALTDLLSIERFLVLSLVGFVLLWEATSPFSVRPRWRARLRPFIVSVYLAFVFYAVLVTYSRLAGYR